MTVTNPYLLTLRDQLRLKAGGWGTLRPGAEPLALLGTSREFLTADGRPHGLSVYHWGPEPGRPIAVYLPGIFQGAIDEDTSRVVVTLREAGYHVVVLPNPLSAEYFANYPVAPPNALAREAEVVTAAVAELRARFGSPRVRMVAASYGAALAVRAWAADQASARPLLADVTLLFPQIDLTRAVTLVDAAIATPVRMNPARAAVGKAYAASLRRLVTRLRTRYAEDARAGFIARRYPDGVARHLDPAAPGPRGRLDLRAVLERYVAAPEVLDVYGGAETSLVHWLETGRAVRGGENVRILTARDDWTNPPGAWDAPPAWLSGFERVLMLDRAGHAGVVAEEWFRRTILEAMRIEPGKI